LQRASAIAGRLLDLLVPAERGSAEQPQDARLDLGSPIRRVVGQLSRNEGLDRLVPVGVCLLLVVAALISSLPSVPAASAAARPSSVADAAGGNGAVPAIQYGAGDGPAASDYSDLYLGDGSIPDTLQNPGVGTDAKALLKTYTVVSGDTLNKIAGKFGLAAATIYWANKSSLPDPSSLQVGQKLTILPVDGLIVTVGSKDTLASLATKYNVQTQDIIDANNLPEPTVVLGQTLIIPGASGGAMPTPKTGTSSSGGGSSSGGWPWPVGGYSYVSQYFWSGHHAIDIAASYGSPVIAAVSGTVIYAGWRSYTGGGNVIWVQDGAKLYTTYNHLSAWYVHVGSRISAGQKIGAVGTSGEATGPHLHFEVWLGVPWGLGDVSDAVNPCRYLAGC